MIDRLSLTHPCGSVVHLVALAGVWTTPRGRVITHCRGCGEWLGSAFTQAEQVQPRRSPATAA